jgi:hypothetical protein
MCCILHNILLRHDGVDSVWQDADNWQYEEGDDEDLHYAVQRARAHNRIILLPEAVNAVNVPLGAPAVVGQSDEVNVEHACHELQAKLVTHFDKIKHTIGWARLSRK